ncbi:MAG: ATP synthase F0 subunit C [Alphaproteobacteria bacterium CG_4_10_14_0_8_um_filter_53_9]|nr:MAG: ATP synthase F0 subunit C [Alphaproteobacteria bacterium CG_4_10_14_0_8_um_filter_53_9]
MEDVGAMKALGAGIAACGMIGSGIGLGLVFGNFFQAVGRQPAVENQLKTYLFIGMALVEAIALFAFVIAAMILFVL